MKKCEEINVLLLLPVVLVAAVVVVAAPVALAALADGLGLHALAQDRRLLLLGGVLGGVRRGHEVPAAQGRRNGQKMDSRLCELQRQSGYKRNLEPFSSFRPDSIDLQNRPKNGPNGFFKSICL